MVRYFINNRISAFMVAAAFLTAGIISLYKLPVSLVPASDYPALSIIIEYPGVGPDKIELLLTKPVERIIKSVSGITGIDSVSEEGKSRINVTFSEKTDIKIASVKIREKIELIKDTFPEEVQEPVVYRYDPSERPVIIAAVDIDGLGVEEIRDIADKEIKPALQRVDGISEINTAGGVIREIHIETDRSRLEARGLTLQNISSAVRSSNISIPGGVVETGTGMNVLNIPSRFRSITDIENTILTADNGNVVYLKDIAVASFSSREREDFSRYNGKDLVTVYIHKGGGANTLGVCRDAMKILNSFGNIKFKIIYNQGEYIESAVNNAAFSGLWGMFIVFIVLTIFFRKKETVIPIALTIPCSMFIVPVFLYAGGRGINIMSLSGFALSAGMVVDNGIVIIEAITSWSDKSIDGILYAVNSVKTAVISSTLTTISVFAPVAVLSSRAESMYGDMAFTVNRALVVSLFTAIILIPAFYVAFKNKGKIKIPEKFRLWFLPVLNKIEADIIKLETACYNYYKNILEYVFNNSFRVITASAGVVFFSAILFSVMDKDTVSDDGGKEFYLYMEFPTGTSLDATDLGVREVEKTARELDGVESVSVKVEKWRGTLTVRTDTDLDAKKNEKLRLTLKNSADAYLKQFHAFSYTSETDEMASREISVHFLGDDTDTLKKIAREASARIKNIEGINECYLRFRDGRPEYCLTLDRAKSSMSGVTASSAAERIRAGLFGPVVTKFIEKGREVDVRVRLAETDRDTIGHVMSGIVKNGKGEDVPLGEILTLTEGEGPTRIYRMNGRRSLSVTAKLGSISMQECEYKIKHVLEEIGFPDEYTYEFDRKISEFRKERNEIITAAFVSVLLIYMILASLFESLLLPFLIMITIPFAAAGAVPFLFITGTPVSPPVYMGFIMLAGIVVNNGILLIEPVNMDFHSGILKQNFLESNIRNSALRRFRPVMLTVVTTVLGMVPLLIGGGEGSTLWFPFALTVTSGLIFSTLLTLALFPLLSFKFYKKFQFKKFSEANA
ncbi:MAG TPA: efflux RND transporter permease subunit [Spirochaetota bacterium]|nr:efflux RND transporter permease subunit [Spirochaetota bacterium]HPS86386.1 efflux RND transporter permease subunit [Spirochaetota bacterium]